MTGGWRARIGVIVPSGNVALEPEFYQMLPDGVSAHFSRVGRWSTQGIDIGHDISGTDKVDAELPRAAEELKEIRPSAVAFGCTGGSFYKGNKYNEELARLISERADAPATTTSSAVLEALSTLGLKRLSVLNPYQDWLSERLKDFLTCNGFEVVTIKNLCILEGSGTGLHSTTAQYTYQLVKDLDQKKADGVFISCTGYKTIEILRVLEEDLQKPVVSANQATLWKLLRMSKIEEAIRGYGSLLE